MKPSDLPTTKKPNAKKMKISSISDAFIIAAFFIIVTSLVFNWMSDYSTPPEQEDFSEYNDPNDAYQIALDNHQEEIRAFEGIYSLFSSIGIVILVAGLFYKTTHNSEHLPDWVRVAMMGGVLYFMIRLFTSELSIVDQIELLALMELL